MGKGSKKNGINTHLNRTGHGGRDKMKTTVDRSGQQDKEPVITVILSCGFSVSFWLIGLSDREYIRRAKEIKKLEDETE